MTIANSYTKLTGTIGRESDKAIRFSVDDVNNPEYDGCNWWVPRSVCRCIEVDYDTGKATVDIADWWLDTKS